jgi:pheromone shutdown-related protein TraB
MSLIEQWAEKSHLREIPLPGKTIILLGTAHISSQSVREVEELVTTLQPDTICVELCLTRYQSLTGKHEWRQRNIFQIIREGKAVLLLANLALAAFQRRLGAQLGVQPGQEMTRAIELAEETKATLVLADRDVQITLKRSWATLGFFKKLQIGSGLMEGLFSSETVSAEEIEALKEKDQLESVMDTFAKEMPAIKTSLIDERDQYMAGKIASAPGERILAVVGAGHLKGILQHLPDPPRSEPLETVPKPGFWSKAVKWLIPLLVVAAFSVGLSRHQGQGWEEMLQAWILPNALFAAILTAVAGGKGLSIVTAFLVSPITSLNPLLAAGMIVGLVEAWLRKPTVRDFETLATDVRSLKGVYRNAVSRTLLVTVLASLGSALGAIIGLSWLFALL